ncbi:hypothetical protein BGZ81_003114 [Podila clonocystis]|nr:hypothetical protein BGZ81_003114 [Podila clonocystis]
MVIDDLFCRPPKVILDKGSDSVFEMSNQCFKKNCKATTIKYINMLAPCYNLPIECPAADIATADAEDTDVEDTDIDDTDVEGTDIDDTYVEGTDVEGTDVEGTYSEGVEPKEDEPENAIMEFNTRDNYKHKGRRHKGHHHDKSDHKKEKHPWAGLCVGAGSFCGNNLFGCDFIPNAVYSCEKTASKPKFVKTCDRECNAGTCGEDLVPVTSVVPTSKPIIQPTSQPSSAKPEPTGQSSSSPSTDRPNPTILSPTSQQPTKTTGSVVWPTSGPDSAQCRCKSDSDGLCGDGFPSECGLSSQGWYKCKKDEKLTPVAGCSIGSCAAKKCLDPCVCQRAGDTCGRRFPPDCGLDENSLFSCNAIEVSPKLLKQCTDGCWTKENDLDTCKINPCRCTATMTACGDAFIGCSTDKNTVYSCVPGTLPEVVEECKDKTCKADDNDPLRASCVKPPPPAECLCKSTYSVCGSSIDPKCIPNVLPDSIYLCTTGQLPVFNKACPAKCAQLVAGGYCIDDRIPTTVPTSNSLQSTTNPPVSSDKPVPTSESVSTSNGPVPTSNGPAPTSDGPAPTSNGPAPTSVAPVPTSNELVPRTTPVVTSNPVPVTTNAPVPTTTRPPLPPITCDSIMQTVKSAISTIFDSINMIEILLPQALRDMIGPVLEVIKGSKDTTLDLISQGGSYVSMAATGIDQLVEVVKALSGQIATMVGIDSSLINMAVGLLQGLTSPLHDLVKCLGLLKDCFGLLKMLGIAIRLAMPTIRAQVPPLLMLVAGGVLNSFEAAAAKMEAGDPSSIATMRAVLTTVNMLMPLMPANIKDMIKLPIDALNAILSQAEKCTP